MTEDDLPPPPQNSGHLNLAPPIAAGSSAESNWPTKNLGESFFDRALANGGADSISTGEPSMPNGTASEPMDAWAAEDPVVNGDEEEDEGWDLDAEVVAAEEMAAEETGGPGEPEADLSEGVSAGVAEDDMWVRNSPLAADHAGAGSFESAMQVCRAFLSYVKC